MNFLYKIICSILIIANFSNCNVVEAQAISVPVVILRVYFPLIDLNKRTNIAKIFSKMLANIHSILNYHNQINIAVHAFIQNGNIVDYNKLNAIRISELWQYKNNFVSALYSTYYITIYNTNTLNTVSNDLCSIFLTAILTNNVELVNRILKCSLHRAVDNTNSVISGAERIKYAPDNSRRQMHYYLKASFETPQHNIPASIANSINYLNNCWSYLTQYFDYHSYPDVKNLSYQMKEIIKQVLDYLYAEQNCLAQLYFIFKKNI